MGYHHRSIKPGRVVCRGLQPGHPQRLVGFRSARLRTSKVSVETPDEHNRSEFGFVFRDFVVLF